MAATGTTHIALLRGINVGGKNKLPMKELQAIFEQAGCTDVKTYIQSGNVIFRAAAPLAKRIPDLVARSIEDRLGLEIPVVTRKASELTKVLVSNPFLKQDPEGTAVMFLADKPTAAAAAALDPDRSPGDVFQVLGREVYLSCPTGMARSKLTNRYFDTKLKAVSTARNWRTVLKLAGLAGVR